MICPYLPTSSLVPTTIPPFTPHGSRKLFDDPEDYQVSSCLRGYIHDISSAKKLSSENYSRGLLPTFFSVLLSNIAFSVKSFLYDLYKIFKCSSLTLNFLSFSILFYFFLQHLIPTLYIFSLLIQFIFCLSQELMLLKGRQFCLFVNSYIPSFWNWHMKGTWYAFVD